MYLSRGDLLWLPYLKDADLPTEWTCGHSKGKEAWDELGDWIDVYEAESMKNKWLGIYTEVYVCVLSCVQFFETPWTIAPQTPLSIESSRQEY